MHDRDHARSALHTLHDLGFCFGLGIDDSNRGYRSLTTPHYIAAAG